MEAELLGWAMSLLCPRFSLRRLQLLCREKIQALAPGGGGAGLELPEPQQGGRGTSSLHCGARLWPSGVLASVFLLPPHLLERKKSVPPLTLAHPLGACCPGLPEGGLAAAQECTLLPG